MATAFAATRMPAVRFNQCARAMSLFFDTRRLGDASREYVAWVDVMGIQATLRRSVDTAANFVYKLHDAALKARVADLLIYPVMDGFYAATREQPTLQTFLRQVFRAVAEEHVLQNKEWFRFVVRGAVARGDVYHGRNLDPDASWSLRDNPQYRDNLLLGEPMVRAHLGEPEAPPFGIYIDHSAEGFIEGLQGFPFDLWWKWYEAPDRDLLLRLQMALDQYYGWCAGKTEELKYPLSRIRIHRGQATLYLRDG